jgi:Xaa-Pro aminopeptidase
VIGMSAASGAVPRAAARRAALRALLPGAGVDALLVTDLVNIRYLTGFTGSNAALVVHADGDAASRLCTDGRYRTQAGDEVPDLETVIDRASGLALAGRVGALGVRRLGFESDSVTVDAHTALDAAAEGVELRRAPGLVQLLRLVKDEGEVAALRAACAAADAALADLLAAGGLAPGRTEREVALDLETRMREHGAAGPAFETIVAAGAHSAIPHHRPTGAALAAGDFVKMDFGALVDGYHSDMTRTVVLGPAAAWQRELYELVAAAQAAGRAALAPGTAVSDVDAAARQVVADAGRGAEFVHGLGHGVGLQIHEAPALAKTGTGALAAGMAVTVEPGVYLEGRGGVRIEDTLVVRDGAPDLLTCTTKELLEV